MKRFTTTIVSLMLMIAAQAQIPQALKIKVSKLKNGMEVWINEDHSQPRVLGVVIVKAGAKDCPNTGIAHYFEHLLFKGTDSIGTVNYAAEKVYLDSIQNKYEELGRTKDNTLRTAIQRDINRLSIKAGDYAIPNEFSNLITRYGGSGLNAFTSWDMTVYGNFFSPQYISQWLELNSHRLLHPVFRLFQGELETVYEEKNMYADNIVEAAQEKALGKIFEGSPYQYPIIGSTENLKNPSITQMLDFYHKYYIANNMVLLLSGDINADSIMTDVEKYFERIPNGSEPIRDYTTPHAFTGETTDIKIPIPLVKAELMAYHSPLDGTRDARALDVAIQLLKNSNQTGLLDSLANTNKVLLASALRESLKDAAAMGFAVIPKLPFGSLKKAEAMCLEQIEKLKKGNFNDETFHSIKQAMIRDKQQNLEDPIDRALEIIKVCIGGRESWDDYLNGISEIEHITREDIMRVSSKYFNTNNSLQLVKKYGKEKKDRISQPGYKPVTPKHSGEESEYAKKLAKMPYQVVAPKLLDFEKDAHKIQLSPLAKLYTVENPMNDLFKLQIIYHRGTLNDSRLDKLAQYLDGLGTDSLSKQSFAKALQRIGAKMSYSANKRDFVITIDGMDAHLEQSLQLMQHFLEHVKSNKKMYHDLITSTKLSEKSFFKDGASIAKAVFEKVELGDASSYLKQTNAKQLKDITGEELINIFKELQQYQMSITYSGRLSDDSVEKAVMTYLPYRKATKPFEYVTTRYQQVSEPTVYLYDDPDARQSIIGTYQQLPPLTNGIERGKFALWGRYFGGNMQSVLFQEIREFRSFAYYANGYYIPTDRLHQLNDNCAYITKLGTQNDKTMKALETLDSLIYHMPIRTNAVKANKQEILNDINNLYPHFRSKARSIAYYETLGYHEDPEKLAVSVIAPLQISDVESFYHKYIQHQPKSIIIVGNKRKLDMKKLASYGKIVELKKADIYR
jgi:predicted Zn-dependent peptidase